MALGDKKRAVMTTDINNSGSDYPVLGPTGDGSNVTAAFTAAGTRTNISTGEKLGVIFGKIAKWFADLGTAAFRGVDTAPTANSTNLVESGGVKSAMDALFTTDSWLRYITLLSSYISSWDTKTISYTGRVSFFLFVVGDTDATQGIYLCTASGNTGTVTSLKSGSSIAVAFSNGSFTVKNDTATSVTLRIFAPVDQYKSIAIT